MLGTETWFGLGIWDGIFYVVLVYNSPIKCDGFLA